MQESSPFSTCPTCQAPIPADAPGGLCPKCALEGAAAFQSSQSGRLAPPPPIEEIAPHFPDLEFIELLGYGAMGAVYKARQPQLDRMVAIKILSHELAKEPAFVERFDREAKMLARLSHPNIVAIHDFGTAGPYCYLKMEHVDGVNLRQAMETGGFKPAEALALVQDVCAALQYAHDEGILHRDIKPENVLIDAKGRAKIADFGIAKMMGVATPMDVTLTLQGSILGTPHYMAPEQIETPSDVDQRADIYSLGVVLYEMLTGELPIGRFALPSEKAAMDARIDEIVLRTLAKEREARYQTAGEVGTQVAQLTANPQAPGRAQPPRPPAESKWARFSIVSTILTGVGLVMNFIFIIMWISTLSGGSFKPEQAPLPPAQEMAWSISGKLTVMILVMAPGLIASVLGLVLGAVAIGDVRKSGGRKRGLGLAMFAALAWPLLIAFALHYSTLRVATPSGGPISVLGLIYTILHWATLLLAVFFMIRGLWRWASGVESEDGQKHFPQIWRTLGLVLALLCFGPVLGAILSSTHSFGDQGHGTFPEQSPRDTKQGLASSDTRGSDSGGPGREDTGFFCRLSGADVASELKWLEGGPESEMSFQIPVGASIDMKLRIHDEGTSVKVCNYTREGGGRNILCIGTAEVIGEGGENQRVLLAMLPMRSTGGAITTVDSKGWEFKDFEKLDKFTNRYGKTSIYVAEHPNHGSLYLDVEIRKP